MIRMLLLLSALLASTAADRRRFAVQNRLLSVHSKQTRNSRSFPDSALLVRGGVLVKNNFDSKVSKKPVFTEIQERLCIPAARASAIALAIATVSYILYIKRATWTPYFNKEYIQDQALSILNHLKPSETADASDTIQYLKALSTYAAGMAAWEMAGLSTIPVETAAGMVFGFRKAAVASLVGKVTGATAAYLLGRSMRDRLLERPAFAKNTVFQLLNAKDSEDQRTHPPLLTAFLMKFSCFPELLKNLGSSLIPVIRLWMFLLVTVVHGGTFTCVWTWLGVDTAKRIHAELPANRPLQVTLVVAAIVGMGLTPLVMAWWIRDLKRAAGESSTRRKNLPRFSIPTLPRIEIPSIPRFSFGSQVEQEESDESILRRIIERVWSLSLAEIWFLALLIIMVPVLLRERRD
jgi:uncharacterized membrane protein YdjX (TVP38/TMEM64 family)